jgi:hypothetical protein
MLPVPNASVLQDITLIFPSNVKFARLVAIANKAPL